jgi:predicted nucleic-acid-binding protein
LRALDTNVLIRLLVGDDVPMMKKAIKLLDKAHAAGESFLIVNPVILEVLWVLKARYELPRRDILDALEKLTLMPMLRFESLDTIRALVSRGGETRYELADLFIGLCAKALDAEDTVTFDKKAARSDLFSSL